MRQRKFHKGKEKYTNLIKHKTNKKKAIIQNIAKMEPLSC